ncbi:MAG: hypothetical protein M3Q39_16300 [Actinomycetota bacterium]|nr:hypothetical protein [Actinomycetota bacterium]
MSRRTLAGHGLDYQTEFVCGPRICKALHCISFDREDPQERAHAEAAFRRLIAQYDAAGYPPGRMPTSFQEEAMRRLPQLRQVTGRIKAALDPDGSSRPASTGSPEHTRADPRPGPRTRRALRGLPRPARRGADHADVWLSVRGPSGYGLRLCG